MWRVYLLEFGTVFLISTIWTVLLTKEKKED